MVYTRQYSLFNVVFPFTKLFPGQVCYSVYSPVDQMQQNIILNNLPDSKSCNEAHPPNTFHRFMGFKFHLASAMNTL